MAASQNRPTPSDATLSPLSALLFVSEKRKREVLDEISHGSLPRPMYYLMLAFSAGIAAFGLIANSAAVVIGAMLVSPLMTPIFGMSLALSRGDLTLLRPALLAEFGGVALIIAFAFFIGVLPFSLEVTTEMLARTKPTLIDLFVATLAGLAGGLAMVDERTSPMLPGVAIATALTPPLATSGLSLAFRAYDGAWGAFLLFFANFLAILAVSAGVFVAAGFVTREQLGTKTDWVKRFSAAGIGLLAVTALLTRQLEIMIEDWRTRNTIVTTLENQLAHQPGASLSGMLYREVSDGEISVLTTVLTPRVLLPQTVKDIQDALHDALGRTVSLFVRCSITKGVSAAGSVSLLPQVDLNGRFVGGNRSQEVRITETAEQVLRQLVSTTRAFTVQDVELLQMPSGPVIVASVTGARPPVPLQVESAEKQIREQLGDQTVTLLVRAVTTDDITAKGRILIGAAHFAALSAEQKSLQKQLEDAGRADLARLRDTSVESIDAAPGSDGWIVRAETAGPRTPTPSDVAAIERHLGQVAKTAVSLSVWASTELIVTRSGYDSVQGHIREDVLQHRARERAASEAGSVSPTPR
jgi:uncharacterized hydrophobic protein (TIGR00271 family)